MAFILSSIATDLHVNFPSPSKCTQMLPLLPKAEGRLLKIFTFRIPAVLHVLMLCASISWKLLCWPATYITDTKYEANVSGNWDVVWAFVLQTFGPVEGNQGIGLGDRPGTTARSVIVALTSRKREFGEEDNWVRSRELLDLV